jgi:hypothetical protein
MKRNYKIYWIVYLHILIPPAYKRIGSVLDNVIL